MSSPPCCLVVFLFCCALSVEARPSNLHPLAKDERTVNTAEGEHTLDFEVLDYFFRKESGKQDDGQPVSGYFDFVNHEGDYFLVEYEADRRGFLPKDTTCPCRPPFPSTVFSNSNEVAISEVCLSFCSNEPLCQRGCTL